MADWWHEKSLKELSAVQWEALCDGCAKCCLHKLEDEDTGKIAYTKVRCRYLEENTCQCSDYQNRSVLVSNCIDLRPANLDTLNWLPSTCAYRLRAQDLPLPEWHPLISGNRDSVHIAGISVRGRAISDEYVHPDGYDEHIVHWIE